MIADAPRPTGLIVLLPRPSPTSRRLKCSVVPSSSLARRLGYWWLRRAGARERKGHGQRLAGRSGRRGYGGRGAAGSEVGRRAMASVEGMGGAHMWVEDEERLMWVVV